MKWDPQVVVSEHPERLDERAAHRAHMVAGSEREAGLRADIEAALDVGLRGIADDEGRPVRVVVLHDDGGVSLNQESGLVALLADDVLAALRSTDDRAGDTGSEREAGLDVARSTLNIVLGRLDALDRGAGGADIIRQRIREDIEATLAALRSAAPTGASRDSRKGSVEETCAPFYERGWRAGHAAALSAPAPSLDAAWAEAEAAASPTAILRFGRSGGKQTRGWATAWDHGEHVATEFADTLPAALRALAARLASDSKATPEHSTGSETDDARGRDLDGGALG